MVGMVATDDFVFFGFLGGLGYLAYVKKRELLAYGLGLLAASFFLSGFQDIVGAEGFGAFLGIFHHVALGAGIAFLAYVAVVEGWKYYKAWHARRKAAEAAFKLKLEGKKEDAAAHPRPASGRESRA